MRAAERQARSVAARYRNAGRMDARACGAFPFTPSHNHRWPVQVIVPQDPREALEQLIRESGTDYTAVSRMLRRNPSYIQQYIKRGSPKKLDERDRRLLAVFFGVPETRLGADPAEEAAKTKYRAVPRLDVRASAGTGGMAISEIPTGVFSFSERWLRELAQGSPDGLSMITVRGDSMWPTLVDGDEIIVNRNDGAPRLRDGIYVLRLDDDLLVKRIARGPARNRITIKSDNPAYPTWHDVDVGSVTIIGRMVWLSRRY